MAYTLRLSGSQSLMLLAHIHDQQVLVDHPEFRNELYLTVKRCALYHGLNTMYGYELSEELLTALNSEAESMRQLPLATGELLLVEAIYMAVGYAMSTKGI
jgi:hypothetical protein